MSERVFIRYVDGRMYKRTECLGRGFSAGARVEKSRSPLFNVNKTLAVGYICVTGTTPSVFVSRWRVFRHAAFIPLRLPSAG